MKRCNGTKSGVLSVITSGEIVPTVKNPPIFGNFSKKPLPKTTEFSHGLSEGHKFFERKRF